MGIAKNNWLSVDNPTELLIQVKDYLDWELNIRSRSKSTLQTKYYTLKLFATYMSELGVYDMNNFNNHHLDLWIKSLSDGRLTGNKCSNTTLNKYQWIIIAFAKYLIGSGKCNMAFNPMYCRKIRKNNITNRSYISRAQYKDIILACKTNRERALVSLFFESGVRKTECSNIKFSDINFGNRSVLIIGKGDKPGTIYLTAEASFYLSEYISETGVFGDQIIWRSEINSLEIGPASVYRILKEVCVRAGYGFLHPHAMRYSFATEAKEYGLDVWQIKNLLRHEDVRTTQDYIQTTESEVKNSYDEMKKQGIYSLTK